MIALRLRMRLHCYSAVCAVLWSLALFTCSLHCTLGGLSFAAKSPAHSCCSGDHSSSANTPADSATKSVCHTFRDIAIDDTPVPRAEFVPQIFTFADTTTLDLVIVEVPSVLGTAPPDPDIGPPAQLPVMRLAGRAPPLAA